MKWNHKQSVKELIKHILYKSKLFSLLDFYRRKNGFVTAHLGSNKIDDKFKEIYRLGTWVHTKNQSQD